MLVFFKWIVVLSIVSIFVYGFVGVSIIIENLIKEMKSNEKEI